MSAPVVPTGSGAVRGALLADGVTRVFRGIPYAMPPVGSRRWTAPEPANPWEAVRDCSAFGPVAVQQPVTTSPLFPLEDEPQSEDCLHLNIWTTALDERRPVIVWFCPGAFQSGSGSAAFYHGEHWARAGVVFVTFNYRLSRLGFLAHPDLSREDPDGVSGNYGLLDQIAALKWVRANIAYFGGDPDCVTIFGVSSGASSISLLMASPAVRGLFHRAIAESGGSFGPAEETTGVGDSWQTMAAAERSGADWARSIGAPGASDLRALDIGRIRAASALDPHNSFGLFDACRPVIDGRVLATDTRAIFEAGRQAPVPLLVGSASNESLGTGYARDRFALVNQARREHGDDAALFLSLYPARTDEEAVAASLRSNGHRLFTWQNWIWANLHAASGHDVYWYRFDQAPPLPEPYRAAGAYHGASIFYTFRHFHLRDRWRWTARDRQLSDTLVEAWVHFARTGRPRAAGLPDWPPFDPLKPRVMNIAGHCELRESPERDYLAFWDRYYRR